MTVIRPKLALTSGFIQGEDGWSSAMNDNLDKIDKAAVVNVRAYGATGNGTTDDTAAITAAIAALDGGLRGTVYFPVGTYKVSSTVTTLATNTHFLGEKGFTSIKCTDPAVTIMWLKHLACSVTNIGFIGPNSAGAGHGLKIQVPTGSQGHCLVDNCGFDGCAGYGIYAAEVDEAVYFLKIDHCTFGTCWSGDVRIVDRDTYPTSYATTVVFERCHFHAKSDGTSFGSFGTGLTRGAVQVSHTSQCSFYNCYWELTNSGTAVSVHTTTNDLLFDNCGFEYSPAGGGVAEWMICVGAGLNTLTLRNCEGSRLDTTNGLRLLKTDGTSNLDAAMLMNNLFVTGRTASAATDDIVLGGANDEVCLINNKQETTSGAQRTFAITANARVSVFGQRPEYRIRIPAVASTAAITTPMKGDLIFASDTNEFKYYNGTAWRTIQNA